MDRRTLNLGILAAGSLALLPRAVGAQEVAVDVDAALAPRVLGSPDAPLTMIEFSSLTCPHCASFHTDVLPAIKTAYIDTGKLRLEMRDFPLDQFALRAAAMARCAPEPRYFALIDMLFKQQSKWSRSDDVIGAIKQVGRFAGIPDAQANACMTNDALLDGILNGRLDGQRKFDVNSTPTFVIGDEIVRGSVPFEEFKKVIDAQLG